MAALTHPRVLTRNFTRFEVPRLNGDLVAEWCAESARPFGEQGLTWFEEPGDREGGVMPHGNQAGKVRIVWATEPSPDFEKMMAGWRRIEQLEKCGDVVSLRTRANSMTGTTISGLGDVVRRRNRDDRIRRLSPERRAAYERIKKLREQIGPVRFDVVEALRELRAHG